MPHIPRVLLVPLALLIGLFFIGSVLAGWGWDHLHSFAADPLRPIACAALIALAILTPVTGCNLDPAVHENAANDWIFFPLAASGLLLGWLSARTERHHVLTIHAAHVPFVGMLLFITGAFLRIASIATLGPRFTIRVSIVDNHRLMTCGLYRLIRHPSYLGVLLTVFGWALVFRSIPGIAVAATMVPPLLSRIGAEEKMLLAAFPMKYSLYQRRTWRLLPLIY